MKTKCEFCGGENARASDSYMPGLCDLCYNTVDVGVLDAVKAGRPFRGEKSRNISDFVGRAKTRELTSHPNFTRCYNVIFNHPSTEEISEKNSERIKDLQKQRHELEAKVVNVVNENFSLRSTINSLKSDVTVLKDRIKAQADASASDKLVIENNQLKEGLARCQVDNDKLRNDLKWWGVGHSNCSIKNFNEQEKLKQQRNDWEKLAGEYRFKAEKLADKVKELERENEEFDHYHCLLIKSNVDLENEVKSLRKWCHENEVLGKLSEISKKYLTSKKELDECKGRCNQVEVENRGLKGDRLQLETENKALKKQTPGVDELPIHVTIRLNDGKNTQYKETHIAQNLRNGDKVEVTYTLSFS